MYEQPIAGPVPVVAGGLLLPQTGGNILLTIVAVTAIAVGTVIIVTTLARAIASRG